MRPAIRLRLSDVSFAHWPVDPAELADHVPDGTSLDVRDGRAWLSVVGMGVRPRFLLGGRAFVQLNVRTYLVDEPPAVHFLDVVVSDRLAALGSRVLADVPATHGRVAVQRTDSGCRVRHEGLDLTVTPEGDPEPAERGTLAHWLVERYRYVDDDRSTHGIEHPPWRLQEASGEVRDRTLLADYPEPAGEPIFHFSPGALVEA